ncbi:cation diffusion facilitator family transporter [Hydrogenothermus marinus]|uniref:Cobalt-zinc-cadmium efflux system protein n=1 Tax=Hydrogenothermus marinus TaxID=133270 RepID=A0A3M0BEQ1_9AQUI|nr:cation diffusion facilitator family transporter [Hydrogenothermus marinus]RMA93065.1 cobalt-zinc-cadmium efflux system protein [Hydrogenothermus marinus]
MEDITAKKKVLIITIILNLIIVFSQIGFGIFAKSTALITDAVHNFQDVLSLVIAFIAAVFAVKKPTSKMTFGYLRAEAMAGFINSAFLVGAIFIVIITAIEKIIYPETVNSIIVIIVGTIALIINSISAYILGFHHHHHEHNHGHTEDLNIKAAYLHLLSDALISLGVVLGGIIMYFTNIYWIDPILAILFSLYILKETIPILKKTFNILMESVPHGFNLEEIEKEIKSFPEVKEVHDIHIWALSSKDIYLTAHILLDNQPLENIEKITQKIEEKLRKKGINHITIQPETKNFYCKNIY